MNLKNAVIIIVGIVLAIIFVVPALLSALYTGIGRRSDGTTDTAPIYGPEEEVPVLGELGKLSEWIRGIPGYVGGVVSSDTLPGGDGTVNQGGDSGAQGGGNPDLSGSSGNAKPTTGESGGGSFAQGFNIAQYIKNDPYTALGLAANPLTTTTVRTALLQVPTKATAVAGSNSRGGLIGPRRYSTNTANRPYNPKVNRDTIVGPVRRVSNKVMKKIPTLGARRPGSRKR